MTLPLLLLSLLPQASAPPQLLASTSGEVRPSIGRMSGPESLLMREVSLPARPWLTGRAWEAILGDLDGDGTADLPEGIDALCLAPGPAVGPCSIADIWFSTDRNGPGYRDGDVLRLTAVGALEVVYSEDDLWQVLAPASGTIDLDALSLAPGGGLLLSLRDTLPGTALGDLEDGAIFGWNPVTGALWSVADEVQVQAWVTQATGSSASFGDLKALTVNPASGEFLFSVQAPGDRDGSVFGNAGGGRLLSGWQEDEWGLGDFELDALAWPEGGADAPPVLDCAQRSVLVGVPLPLQFLGGATDEGVVALLADRSDWNRPGVGGFALQIVDRFAPHVLALPQAGQMGLRTGALGNVSWDLLLPAVPPALLGGDLLLQAAGGRSGLSTPLRLRLQ